MNLPSWLQFTLSIVGGWAAGAATVQLVMGRRLQKIEQTMYGTEAEPGMARGVLSIRKDMHWLANCVTILNTRTGGEELPARPSLA